MVARQCKGYIMFLDMPYEAIVATEDNVFGKGNKNVAEQKLLLITLYGSIIPWSSPQIGKFFGLNMSENFLAYGLGKNGTVYT